MALTAAEKQRRYREKRKLDAEREAAYKEKQKKRNARRKKISDMNSREQRRRRREWREWDKSRRQKKALLKNLPPTPPDESPSERSLAQHGSRARGRRVVRRDRAKVVRDNNALRKELGTTKRAYWRIIKRFQRAAKKQEPIANQNLTPSSKMKHDINEIEGLTPQEKTKIQKSNVARTLVFHNAVVDTLKSTQKTSKKVIRHLLLHKVMRKYRLTVLGSKALGYKDRVRSIKKAIKRQSRVKSIIEGFFISDDVSRATAGKKETVTKGKVKMQKRWLLEPMTTLHSKFTAKHGVVSYATFARYRPFYVCPPRIDGRDTCLCQYHANVNLLVIELKKRGIVSTCDAHTICNQTVCDKNSFDCCYNLCLECKDRPPVLLMNEIDDTLSVSWQQWGNTVSNAEGEKPSRVTRKENFEGTLYQLVELFKSKMIHFKKHIFNIRSQNAAYKQCKARLDDTSAILHIDYSENYACKYSEEVQSHHFGGSRNQVSLQTGVLYIGNEPPLCFGTVCANTDHSPAAIWAHLHPLLELLKEQHPLVKSVHFFSDGPTTQYRQKKNFFLFQRNVAKYDWKVGSWSFFEASHGKGPADGVGGTLKRTADSLVAHGTSIPDAHSFYDHLKNETKVQLFFIESEEIGKIETKIPEDLQPVKHTRSVHQVIAFPNSPINKHRSVSCYCERNDWNGNILCDCNCKFLEHQLLPEDEDLLEETLSSSESSDQNEDDLSLHDESSDFNPDELDSVDNELEAIIRPLEHPDEMKPGVFMLVQFKGGPRNATTYQYVGVCQSFDEDLGEIEVMFLKVVGENASLFRMDEEDVASVRWGQVIGTLPNPSLKLKGNRVFYKFPASIDVKEKH